MKNRRGKVLKLDGMILVSILTCALLSLVFFLKQDIQACVVAGQLSGILIIGFLRKKSIDHKYKDL